ncbi:hypothetical protein K523DRAFT_3202 [Schizophyllum commune Tattone D]|nr:hypothetical protein K523DRAFT_3202 [Schizophyllum commune Tattone D]
MHGRPRVIDAIAVLEVPKAPPEPPEREFGFLGVIEDLHQALGVIEPFLRDPRAAGGMRGRPRAMNATPHKQLLTRGAARAARSREAARVRGHLVEGTRSTRGMRSTPRADVDESHAATDECAGSSRKRRQDTVSRARGDAGTRADGRDHDRANHGHLAAAAAARMRRRRRVKRFDYTPPHTPSRRSPA